MNAQLQDAVHRSRLRAIIGAVGLSGLGFVAIVVALSDVIARVPANTRDAGPISLPPDVRFVFGTDVFGRDVMSETVHALAVTVITAALSAIIVIGAGAVAGFGAARLPWRLGTLLRAVSGVLGTVPVLLLAIVITGLIGHGFAALAAGLAASPLAFNRSFDRAMRLAHSRHAEYARATGVPGTVLLRRDLVYEIRANFINVAGRALASTAIVLSTMSFLGFGAEPAHRDLGLMIAAARANYLSLWWPVLFPALALVMFILFARLAAVPEDGEAA